MHSTRELNYCALALDHSLVLLVNEMITSYPAEGALAATASHALFLSGGNLTLRSSLSYNPSPAITTPTTINTPLIPVAGAAFVL